MRLKHFLSVFLTLLTLAVGQMWGALSSPYECTFTAGMSMSGSNCTTGDVTWTITTTTGKGSPTTTFGNQNGQSCIKLGSGQNHYYSKITLTTSAFTSYNVTSVVIYASSNNGGSKTFKVMQGETQIGTGSQSFSSTTWVSNITRNTNAGSGGDLSIEISNDKTATFIHSIKVTYSAPSCTVTPTVGSSLSSVEADVNSITATVPISAIGGCNITENGLVYSTTAATPTVGGTGCTKVFTTACGATAANKTVTINELACGTTYYVRGYATNAAGTSYTNVTTQSTSACPTYTVTLKDDDTELEQATAGAAVTLPSRSDCPSQGFTFAGWTKSWTSAQTVWTTTAPDIIDAGSYTPQANENLYPVYTKEDSGEGFTGYTKVTSAPSDWSGQYLISDGTSTATGVQFSATALTITTLTPGTTEYPAYEFTITKNGNNNNYYIISPDGTYYVGYSGSSANLVFSNDPSTNNYLWTCQASNPMTLNVGTTTRYIGVGTESQTSVFKAYSTSGSNTKCYLYKRTEGETTVTSYISVPNCCSALGSINGSVSWSNDGTSLTVKNWGYTKGTGAAESNISKYTVYLYSDNDSYAASIDNADCTVANRASTGVTFDGLSYARTYKVKITATPADGYCPVDDVWSSTTYKLTCATPTAATAGSFARATQKMPISWTSGAGKVDICYSSNSSTPAATPGSGYTVVSNQTSSPVNLDVSGLAAGNYYCWVRSVCDASNKSSWTAITGSTFTIPAHTLTITKDGGGTSTITPASGTAVVEGRTASVEASPATGYKFVNWAVSGTNAELSSTTDNPTTFTMGTADATVTGTFGLISYKVRFNKNNDDATGSMDDQTFTYGESKELSANAFELTNYTFSGWATTQEGAVAHEDEAEVENLSTADGAIVNLYAVWTANSHSVTYVANDKTDGTVPTDANSPYNHNAQVTVLGGGTLEKEHYAFVGWTDGVTNYVAGNKFTITDDVTLSARWTCDEKVTVSEGTPTNGSFTLDNSGVLATCDAAVVVTVSPSANPGYEFDAITVDGVGTKDDNAKKVTYAQNTSGTSEINVTFKAKSLSVTWNLNYEGAPDPTEVSYTYDGSSLTLPEPVREGYTFDGWFTATEDGDEIDNVGGSNKPFEDKVYYAHWSPISCDVVWKVNGVTWTPKTTTGEGQDGSANADYDAKVSQLPTPPTNADGCGDRFMGWTATENYKGNSAPADLFNDVEHAPLIKANPTTYYAVFADYVE